MTASVQLMGSEPRGERLGQQRLHEFTLLVFMATVVMLFAGFTAAYLIRRSGTDWTPLPLPRTLWLSTALCLLGSVTIELARRHGAARWLWVTSGLGVAFLAAQATAWQQVAARGPWLAGSAHVAFLVLLTAVHGLHVLGGIAALLAAAWRRRGPGAARLYWHFVGALWLCLYVLLAQL